MWELDANRPIYLQIAERLELAICSGVYQPGERIPSVRDLAAQAGVNPNTMQRALTEIVLILFDFTQSQIMGSIL